MQARRRELTIEQLKEEFREVDTESNPFFDEKPINVTIDNLVNAYLDSCEHWNRYVVGQFSK